MDSEDFQNILTKDFLSRGDRIKTSCLLGTSGVE